MGNNTFFFLNLGMYIVRDQKLNIFVDPRHNEINFKHGRTVLRFLSVPISI